MQDAAQGGYATDAHATSTTATCSATDSICSNLGNIETLKGAAANYHLKLDHTVDSTTVTYEWTQTSSPLSTSLTVGYTAISVPLLTTVYPFAGLSANITDRAIMDGTTSADDWCHAVGGKEWAWNGIPMECTGTYKTCSKVVLYISRQG